MSGAWLGYVLASLALLAVSFAFGVVLKLSDLLQEHDYHWFPRSAFVTGLVSAGLAVVMLALGTEGLAYLWMGVLASWIVRARIDGPNHGVMALAMLCYLGWSGPRPSDDPAVLLYFLVPFVTLGAVHDLLQYTALKAPRLVKKFFEHQHLYWYLIAAGYCALFEIDSLLVLCVYGFVKGYGLLYDEGRRAALARWGIVHRPPPGAPR